MGRGGGGHDRGDRSGAARRGSWSGPSGEDLPRPVDEAPPLLGGGASRRGRPPIPLLLLLGRAARDAEGLRLQLDRQSLPTGAEGDDPVVEQIQAMAEQDVRE